MKKIDTTTWKSFRVGELFDIHPTKAYKFTNSILFDENGTNPVVVNSSYNNGIGGYTSYPTTEKGGIITFSDTTSADAIFYQGEDFVGYPHIQGMYPTGKYKDCWSEKSLLFFVSIFRSRAINSHYDYVNKFTRDSAKEMVVMLPVDKTGNPDFAYMEEYMQNLGSAVSSSLTALRSAKSYENCDSIDVTKWRKFKISDIFEKLELKILKTDFNKIFDVSEIPSEEFSLPLVNAKHFNNGIMYYGRETDFESAEMTIDIVKNGAIATGDVFAQPQKTGVLWDAYLIKPKDYITSELVLLFLATILQKTIKGKFSYDDKCVWERVKKLEILLPVTNNQTPDYDFMLRYMKTLKQNSSHRLAHLQLA